ncbi:MAG: cell envelope protein SmpA [Alphaproteobacteria bacterium]|nr:cell envelope protein SmpA [Alphaproteobacteria bacterium]HCQ71341.1 outer membrane protein assembly factor BamE [Rhodospirillaceae bacterium]
MTRMALLFFSLSTLITSACAPTLATRGNLIEDEQITKVKIGFHTRSDVMRAMGSPTTTAPFDDHVWYYIGQETTKKGILDPEVVNERIVMVTFDDAGVVQKIEDIDAERMDVALSRERTQTHGNDYTVMQQLLGNLGRFNTQK